MHKLALVLVLGLATGLGATTRPAAPDTAQASPPPAPAVDVAEFGDLPRIADEVDALVYRSRLLYSARPQDQEFLRGVVDRYLDSLDPARIILTQQDERMFKNDPRWVRAAMRGRAIAAPLKVHEIFITRVDEGVEMALEVLDDKDFSAGPGEEWEIDRSRVQRPSTEKMRKQAWKDAVRNDRLALLDAGNTEQQADKSLRSRYVEMRDYWRSASREDVASMFFDAYTRSFDPHTEYMAPRQADDFAIALHLSLEGIGASLEKEGGIVRITSVVEDSPASRAGLAAGDEVVAVAQDGKVYRPVAGRGLPDVVADIRGKKGSMVGIEIRRIGNQGKPLEKVLIARDTIQIKDQKASWEMRGHEGEMVAVVRLPLFYHGPGGAEGNSASRDTAKAIEEASTAGADAVVLDLRGNGGGSLAEAIGITGLFVPPSPVVMVRSASGDVETLQSTREQPLWTGPLVVMVDRRSASASEIVSGALQDLGRALVVGEQTHGKGTVQSLIDLDAIAGRPAGNSGQVKITISQFFRPSGLSTQLVGVMPDVELGAPPPKSGERIHDNALPSARIKPAIDPGTIAKLKSPVSDGSVVVAAPESSPQAPSRLSLDASIRKKQLAQLDGEQESRESQWLDMSVIIASEMAMSDAMLANE